LFSLGEEDETAEVRLVSVDIQLESSFLGLTKPRPIATEQTPSGLMQLLPFTACY